MLDADIIKTLAQVLRPALSQRYPNLLFFVQANQPSAQGTPTQETLFINKVNDNRYGFARTDYAFKLPPGDPMTDYVPADTVQLVQSRFQIMALTPDVPNDPSPATPSELLRYMANLMSVDAILTTLHKRGVHILRIRDVVNPFFEDDATMYEAAPSLDLIIQHHDTISIPVPRIVEAEPEIHAV